VLTLNHAGVAGGAVFDAGSTAVGFSASNLTANSAGVVGGALFAMNVPPQLNATQFDGNSAQVGSDVSTAPVALRVTLGPTLFGPPGLCNASVDVRAGPLRVPSGCGLTLLVDALDAYGVATVPPSTEFGVVSLSDTCPGTDTCLAGFTQQILTPAGSPVNITIAGGVGSTVCVALQLRSSVLPQPVLAASLMGQVSDCAAGAVAPAVGSCDTCRVCPEGLFLLVWFASLSHVEVVIENRFVWADAWPRMPCLRV
jgi:hypothetical protein